MVRIDINFTPGKQPEIRVNQDANPAQPHAQQPGIHVHPHGQPHAHVHPNPMQQAMHDYKQLNDTPQMPAKFVTSDALLGYLLGTNIDIETMILCKPNDLELITSDYNLYEAFGSLKPDDNIPLNKITKLFEAVHVTSFKEHSNQEKPILKEDRVEELRLVAQQAKK
ncbi:MAG TPA: hypothetical protein VJB66_02860 [Candidatus Nanoarchaeia archaeon]|nr:hypothetical protein [Candidatus Nanoarchaeia archaeon]